MSEFFDRCFDEGLFHRFEEWENKRAGRLLEMFNIRKDFRVVEPGCGCGRMTRLLAEKIGPKGKLHACEISPKMIEYCRSLNLSPRVEFHAGSVRSIDLPENYADCILCFNVWPHFTDREGHLDFFRKLIRPGGLLYIAHSCSRAEVNAIHKNSSDSMIHGHMLPPAEELGDFLSENEWNVTRLMEDDEIYFVEATTE